ncbi:MAG: hypothetical protein AABW92_00440 [Nanoarchaeota archaeon]
MDNLSQLRLIAHEFFDEAEQSELNNSLNTAATLYFKAIVVALDFHILKHEKLIPKNHTERFYILKSKYNDFYLLLDRDFPLYQKTYSLQVNKEQVELLKDDCKKIFTETDIK